MNVPATPLSLPWWPHLRWTRPAPAVIAAVRDASRDAPLTYDAVGATAGALPDGWYCTEQQVTLGSGPEAWDRAVEALRAWRMFDMPWVVLDAPGPPTAGDVLAFASHQYGLWALHAVRVVDAWSTDDGQTRSCGFAYGTLPRHAVRGEERFTLSQQGDGPVLFTIRQFSRPSSRALRVLGRASRGVQDAFVDGALAAMVRAVSP